MICVPLKLQNSSAATAQKNNISADSHRLKEMTYCADYPPTHVNVPDNPPVP